MYFDKLNSEEQVTYLIKPIIEVLQEAGGQLERSEIRDRIGEKTRGLRSLNRNCTRLAKPEINIKSLILSLILLSKN